MTRVVLAVTMLAVALPRAPAGAAVSAAPGWAVREIPAPGTVQGGVVRRAGALLVGQGEYGGGLQSIVRVERAGVTTIATGFNSLGGFDLDADGTLWVVDNCGECPGATTGDTLYAIPDALSRTTAIAAAAAEALAAGSLPAAQDALALADGSVLVTDAGGPGAGRVVRVAGGVVTDLITGLDFLGGLVLHPDGRLRVANVDATFTGAVLRYALDGTPAGTLAGGLSGAYAVAVDGESNVLVSGGMTDDFSSSTVVAIAPDGTVAERARGFGYSGDLFHDPERDETLVLDWGATAVTALCRDRDGDGRCDCAPVAAPTLRVKGLATPPGDERFALRGTVTVPAAPPLDPRVTGARVVIEGVAGTLLDAAVPPGRFDRTMRRGWRKRKEKFAYRNPAGVPGIVRMTLGRVRGGAVKVAVVGRRVRLAAGPDDLPLSARIELDPEAGQCGVLRFPGAACLQRRADKVTCR